MIIPRRSRAGSSSAVTSPTTPGPPRDAAGGVFACVFPEEQIARVEMAARRLYAHDRAAAAGGVQGRRRRSIALFAMMRPVRPARGDAGAHVGPTTAHHSCQRWPCTQMLSGEAGDWFRHEQQSDHCLWRSRAELPGCQQERVNIPGYTLAAAHVPIATAILSPRPMAPSRWLVVSAAIGIALLTASWRFLTFTGFNNDHYIYLAGAQQMVLGEWPVRDFVDPGWPLMYAVSAFARVLFGRELLVELLVVASAFAIGAGFTLATAARLSGSVIVALLVTLLEVGLNPRSFGYPKLLLYAIAGWVLVWAARRMSHPRVVLLAALTVVAFLFRHDHGLYIGAGSLAVIVFASWRDGAQALVRRPAVFAAAVAACLLPWAVFVQLPRRAGRVSEAGSGILARRGGSDGDPLASVARSLGRSGRDADQLGGLAVLSVPRDAGHRAGHRLVARTASP